MRNCKKNYRGSNKRETYETIKKLGGAIGGLKREKHADNVTNTSTNSRNIHKPDLYKNSDT